MRVSQIGANVIFAVVSLAIATGFPVDAQCEQLRGIFALGEGGPIPAEVLNNPRVDGVALRYSWKKLEPFDGVFNWTQVDEDIAQARRHNKFVSIGVTPGIKTPPWVYRAGAAQFSYTWDKPWGPPACSQQQIPIPWDPVYLSKWKQFVQVFGSKYDTNPSVVYVKITGINAGTQELILPHSQGHEKNILSVGCSSEDQTRAWQRAGYTRRKIESLWLELADTFARAFPHKFLGLMIGPRGLPPIDDGGSVMPQYGADLQLPYALIDEGAKQLGEHFVLQNNGLSAVKSWETVSKSSERIVVGWQMVWSASADPRCRMNGGAMPCESVVTLTAATQRGVDSGAQFLEIYLADLMNPQLQEVLQLTHERLLKRPGFEIRNRVQAKRTTDADDPRL